MTFSNCWPLRLLVEFGQLWFNVTLTHSLKRGLMRRADSFLKESSQDLRLKGHWISISAQRLFVSLH
jgi:hypothetical protein